MGLISTLLFCWFMITISDCIKEYCIHLKYVLIAVQKLRLCRMRFNDCNFSLKVMVGRSFLHNYRINIS